MRTAALILVFSCLIFCSQPTSAVQSASETDSVALRLTYEKLVADGVARGLIDSLYMVPYSIKANTSLPPRKKLRSESLVGYDGEDFFGELRDSLLIVATAYYGEDSEFLIPFWNLKGESLLHRLILGQEWPRAYKEAKVFFNSAIAVIESQNVKMNHPAILRLQLNLAYCSFFVEDYARARIQLEHLIPALEQVQPQDNISLAYCYQLLARCMLEKNVLHAMNTYRGIRSVLTWSSEEYGNYLVAFGKVKTEQLYSLLKKSLISFKKKSEDNLLEVRHVLEILAPIYYSQNKYVDYLLAIEGILYADFSHCSKECVVICYDAGNMLYGNIKPELITIRLSELSTIEKTTQYEERAAFSRALLDTYRALLKNMEEQKNVPIEERLFGPQG